MQSAVKNIQHSTLDFLTDRLGKITDYREANKILYALCGVNSFFRHHEDFSMLLELLKPSYVVCESSDRREYGDFQTPAGLSDSICSYLKEEGLSPEVIIEPTFGKGSFIISALANFQKLKKIYGLEIYEPYYWQTKFAVLEFFIKNPVLSKPDTSLYLGNIFEFNFTEIKSSVGDCNILILGNPPWVTNSELGSLRSHNLPEKSNLKALNGLDAITGKGNFDICEYIVLMMIKSFGECQGHISMLTKNSVIKNLIHDLPTMKYGIGSMTAFKIDAKKYFNASVEASLFKCSLEGSNKAISYVCNTSSLINPHSIENTFGWVSGKFVSDTVLYEHNKKYDGISPYIWRQGIKHDCSNVMELELLRDNTYRNGFGEEIDIEDGPVYGLLKSSDLNSPVITRRRKYVIVPQRIIGESTAYIEYKFPKLHQYLTKNKLYFEQRKSGIYKNKPPFSIFGVGEYSFKLYKVAISGLYKRSSFSLMLPENGKPVMLDDTCYFLSFDSLPEAVFVWAILNSEHIQRLLASITFLDSKRPYTKDVLMRLSIDRFAGDMSHEEIVQQIRSLDEAMLVHVGENEWKLFQSGNSNFNVRERDKQSCLF